MAGRACGRGARDELRRPTCTPRRAGRDGLRPDRHEVSAVLCPCLVGLPAPCGTGGPTRGVGARALELCARRAGRAAGGRHRQGSCRAARPRRRARVRLGPFARAGRSAGPLRALPARARGRGATKGPAEPCHGVRGDRPRTWRSAARRSGARRLGRARVRGRSGLLRRCRPGGARRVPGRSRSTVATGRRRGARVPVVVRGFRLPAARGDGGGGARGGHRCRRGA